MRRGRLFIFSSLHRLTRSQQPLSTSSQTLLPPPQSHLYFPYFQSQLQLWSLFQSRAMASRQSTLGKFFGDENGAKPAAPRQSKLAFSNKSSLPPEGKSRQGQPLKKHDSQNPTIQPNDRVDEENDVEMDDQTDKSLEVPGIDEASTPPQNGVKKEPQSQQSPRKRPANVMNDANDNDDDDDVPIKRRRMKQEGKKHSPESEEKTGQKERMKAKQASRERASEAVVGNGKPSNLKKPVKQDRGESIKSHRIKAESPSEESHVEEPKANTASSDVEEDAVSEEEEDQEEEERPEAAAKSREKVQSTLTSKSKDPYPDWKPGDPVPYAALCTTFSKIEMTTKRLEISAHCSKFLQQVLRLTPKDLLPTILLMTNKLAADYTGIELGIGESLIMKAIGETTGRSLSIIKADQQEIGDLGLVAAKSRSNQPTMFKPKPLTVRGVHEGLMSIATTEGQGAQGRKIAGIKKLLSAADANLAGKGNKGVDITKDKGGPSESKYIIRTLEGKMRLGLAEKTVLVALSQAMVFHETYEKNGKQPSTDQLAKGETMLKSVYNELPSYEVIVPALIEHGIFNLHDSCKLQPGVPLKPMLAKPTKSISEVLDRFEGKDFSCEYKYDGERAQIHFVSHDAEEKYATAAPSAGKNEKGVSNIFSRNSEDLSKKYPDILDKLPKWVKSNTKSFVLDCETVAWDVNEKQVLPFQQLMTRKRKDVKTEDIKVKVCVFAFDMLFLNGEALVNKPFRERREKMHNAFSEVEGEFSFAKYGNTNELDRIQDLLEESVKASCEGLMVKMLDGVESHYEPSRRSQNWLKVKKDYLQGAGDSIDLVVIGAYYGKGKRTSVYGAFLLACYDPNSENYETVCNIGTGFSEAILEELHKQLEPIIIDRPKPFYSHSSVPKDQPDVWFEPRFVWEVKSADFTISPRYRAAAAQMDEGVGGKGVSLRFPRFLKIRDDKKPVDATSSRTVAEMYRKQDSVAKNKGPSVDDDFEY